MGEMAYSEFVEVYEELDETTKRLEKEKIIAKFLHKIKKNPEWIYLLRGRVVPDWDVREIGISDQLTIKAISFAFGIKDVEIYKSYRKIGDLGKIAEEFAGKKKQSTLFHSKLSVGNVFDNLKKIMDIQGKGTVGKKIGLIAELLGMASGKEAKYIVRTLLGQLRVGVAEGIVRDAIAECCFPDEKQEMSEKLDLAYEMSNDFATLFSAALKGKKELDKIGIVLGRPLSVMLAVKAEDIEDGFRICGKPCAIEDKYDGFRVVINKMGKEFKLFTRRLEDVTKQFPDVIKVVRENVKGENFILDSEVVGYDPKTGRYRPFEAISQRIKRKYDIDKLEKDLPVEINVFDVLYYNGKSLMTVPFRERRKIVEKIIHITKWKIRPSNFMITDDEKKVKAFYEDALRRGEEGIMFKKLDVGYQQGRRVGYIAKMKPVTKELDLVITGAEYGSGKRGGLLTSYIVACREGDEFLNVGMVSSGLKEKSEMGTSFSDMDKMLRPLIIEKKAKFVKVRPKIVVSVTYQNIQKSPSYNSRYAMRFPRITNYRPDRSTKDIATLGEIKREAERKSERGEKG